MLEIDGSYGEGGGAILRVAAGMSVATSTPVKVFNIRKNRPRPGLKAQHLHGLRAAAEVCGGSLEGGALGSEEIMFTPGNAWKEKIRVQVPTAGSLGLVLQVLQLACVRAPHSVSVEMIGGASYGKWAPPLDYVKNTLFRHLYRARYQVDLQIETHGFYPVGKAIAGAVFNPVEKLEKFCFEELGKAQKISGISVASKMLEKANVAGRQKKAARQVLYNEFGISPEIEEQYVDSACPGSGIVVWIETDTECILGGDCVGERGVIAEVVGRNAAEFLVKDMKAGNCVDVHLLDQLIPFMALAAPGSVVKYNDISKHCRTNIWVVEQFLGKKFLVKEGRISCES